ncbi:MAG TPA: hypothetical protein VL654_13285 [Casimicrobiaceae bacterium]|jgi:hypothetical protein|nr:hypothetical protein [Casimicrobiaceae bacterium]
MANYKQRLEKIERSADSDNGLRILWVGRGESEADVLAKAGPYSGRTLLTGWEDSDRDL